MNSEKDVLLLPEDAAVLPEVYDETFTDGLNKIIVEVDKWYMILMKGIVFQGEDEEEHISYESRYLEKINAEGATLIENFDELWEESWIWEEVTLSEDGLIEVVISRLNKEIVLSKATETTYELEGETQTTKEWKSKYFPLYPISAEDIIAQFDEFWELDPVMTLESDYVVSEVVEEDYQIAGQVLEDGIDLGEGYENLWDATKINFPSASSLTRINKTNFEITLVRSVGSHIHVSGTLFIPINKGKSYNVSCKMKKISGTVAGGFYFGSDTRRFYEPLNNNRIHLSTQQVEDINEGKEIEVNSTFTPIFNAGFDVDYFNRFWTQANINDPARVLFTDFSFVEVDSPSELKPFIKNSRPDSKLALPQLSSLGELESLDTETGVAQHTNGTVIFKDPKFDSNMPDKSIQAMLLPNKDNRLEFKTDPRNPVKLKTYMDKALDDCIVEENADFIFYNDNPTGEAVFKAQYDKKNKKIITANSRIEFDKLDGVVVKNPVLRDPANEPDKDIVFGLQATNITGKWRLCSVAKDPTALPVGWANIKYEDETDGSSVFYDVGRTSTANNIAGKITVDGEIYIGERYENLAVTKKVSYVSSQGSTVGVIVPKATGLKSGDTVNLSLKFLKKENLGAGARVMWRVGTKFVGSTIAKDVTAYTIEDGFVEGEIGIWFQGLDCEITDIQITKTSTPKPYTDSSVPNGALKIAKDWVRECFFLMKGIKSVCNNTVLVFDSLDHMVHPGGRDRFVYRKAMTEEFDCYFSEDSIINPITFNVSDKKYDGVCISSLGDKTTTKESFKQLLIYKGSLTEAEMENELSKDIRLEWYKFPTDIPNPKFICGISGIIDNNGYNKLYAKSVNGQLPSGYENIEYWEEENGVYADMPAPTEGGI